MFAEFDESLFPIVRVKLSGSIDSQEDFDSFIGKWLEYYENKKDFIFYFDTLDVTDPPLTYCFQMSSFIKKLRKKEYQYLQKSIILINSNKIKWLLDFIFLIQPPVAPVYIYNISNGISENIESTIEIAMNHPETSKIQPSKPFLPLF